MPELLDIGVRVTSSDGKHVGNLRHVVLDRDSFKAQEIVVDIGPLRAGRAVLEHGVLGDYDRIVSLADIAAASEDGIVLKLSAEAFMSQRPYTDDRFGHPPDLSPEKVDLSDIVRVTQTSLGSIPGADSMIWVVPTRSKPKDYRDVEEGTPVWRQDPHEKIGEVDKLLVDEETGLVTAFVIRRGFLLKRDVVLSTEFVTELLEDIVRVQLSDADIESLPAFEEP